MAEALAGSQPAYERIVRRYQRPIISLIARMTGDRALAEDLAQETFVKAFRNLAAFDTTRRLSSWLLRIAHNAAVDAMRRSHMRMVPLESDDGLTAGSHAAPAPSIDSIERAALGNALDAALAGLRPEHRAAVVLRYEQGLAFDEIGHVLGVAEATARSHVHRARKELARRLTAAGWEPAR